jgi:hypothetical protein
MLPVLIMEFCMKIQVLIASGAFTTGGCRHDAEMSMQNSSSSLPHVALVFLSASELDDGVRALMG